MQKNPKARYLPIVMFPAIMPAVLMRLLLSLHVPANVIGAAMGVSVGLAIVGIVWMVKGGRWCSNGS